MSDIEPIYATLGLRIRAARRKHHPRMSQQDVADRVQLPRSAISAIEGGRQRVLVHTLLRLCEVLDVDVSNFLIELEETSMLSIQADPGVTEGDLDMVKKISNEMLRP
jgi:transcriptional regulator with XRE-family HTH domain